ncbi:Uncharacterized protein Rs2_29756 [Raphanus sativus]|nr:Uncharacterized protein Rs2_29756 [Raphanus sativus]
MINGLKPLEMFLDISLSGEIKQVELEYEDLGKHCFACFSLSHEKEQCPVIRSPANPHSSAPLRMGISQTRTLDRLDADKRKQDAKSQARSNFTRPSNWDQGGKMHWQSNSSHSFDWNQERQFRYDYGARKDPNHTSGAPVESNPPRKPAKARLSFTRENSSASFKESHS